jgi:thioesterase domain-containing protein
MFLIHPVGGTVLPYTPLAAELADRYRVYGIQSPALVAEFPSGVETLAELASSYLAELRAVQPTGPYRIGGWSMGGLLSHQIVAQLEQAGEQVELMILLDAPFAIPDGADEESRLARLFVADALRTLGRSDIGQPESDRVEDQLACLITALNPTDRVATAGELRRRLAVFTEHRRLMAGYRPVRPVRAATLLIGARRSPNAAVQHDWTSLAGGPLQRIDYDTDHYGLLQPPCVADLAARIRAGGIG